jgi:predicted house-cleaning NTP pyrophosphatase (Maf/HAM1 superfamily)
MMKAVAAQKMLGPDSKMDVFLGSDTTVVVDGEALGKPTSESHAKQMLKAAVGPDT